MEKTSDIIRGCISGSAKHQRLLYEQYHGFALKTAFRYIYTYEKATDVVNDSFVKLFNHFHSFRTGRDADNEKILMGWLKKIVINKSIDHLRKKQMLPEIGGIPESGFEIADNSSNADQQVLYRDLIILVKKLPPAFCLAFNLYVIDGYSHAEIASMMGTSISNSKSNLSRARAILQNGVKKMEEEKICRI